MKRLIQDLLQWGPLMRWALGREERVSFGVTDWRYIADWLISVPAPVSWDRFILDDDGTVTVYGWIDRDDGQRDFLVLRFVPGYGPEFVATSSAKYSREFSVWLSGDPDVTVETVEHNDCRKCTEIAGLIEAGA